MKHRTVNSALSSWELPLYVSDKDRNAPAPDFIALMQGLYPTEREMDAILSRKMAHRHSSAVGKVSLADLSGYLAQFLRGVIPGDFEITEQRWFAGGASKIQMGFTLHWRPAGSELTSTKMVVRMEPAESLNSTSRAREFELLKTFAGVIPVPQTFWVDAEGASFPEPALIYAFADGVTKPRKTHSGSLSGIGTQFGDELRSELGAQFVHCLAEIHKLDVSRFEFKAFDRPRVGTTESALWQLNRARRVWEEDRGIELPVLEVAANWLERNMHPLDHVSVVHGDYRSGNFLYNEETRQISAILDWERGYLGDRHRDLAWTTSRIFGSTAEDGHTFLVSGLMPLNQFLEDYERKSGLRVDPERMRYYTIFNAYQVAVAAIGTSHRVVSLSKSHQDILLCSTEAVGYGALEMVRQTLEELL